MGTIQFGERLRHRAIAPCLELLFVDGVHVIGDPNERAETHLVFRQGFLAIRDESGRGGTDLVPARKVRDEIPDAPAFSLVRPHRPVKLGRRESEELVLDLVVLVFELAQDGLLGGIVGRHAFRSCLSSHA